MFVKKSETSIIKIDEEIKIVGLNLQGSGMPITFESLVKMWDRDVYTESHREKTKHVTCPVIEYGVCVNSVPDYVVGRGVSSFEGNPKDLYQYVLPAGWYIKQLFNAEDFDKLVNVELTSGNQTECARKWAQKNSIKILDTISVEVYPMDAKAMENPEMYLLFPIQTPTEL